MFNNYQTVYFLNIRNKIEFYKKLNKMNNTEKLQLLIGIGQIIAVAIIPIIVWILGIKYQDRRTKKDAQLNLFLTLMANRKSNPITKEWIDALNTIDVVFQDNIKVRHAWREYLDSLNNKSPHFETSNSFLLDLLSEMSMAVGYGNLKQTEIDRFYLPVYFTNQLKASEDLTQSFQKTLNYINQSFAQKEIKMKENPIQTNRTSFNKK